MSEGAEHRSASNPGPGQEIAVLCSGAGVVWRGFEQFGVQLAKHLAPHFRTALLASAPLPDGIRVRSVRRDSKLLRSSALPRTRSWNNLQERNLIVEMSTFSLSALVWMWRHRTALAICVEPLVARRLMQARQVLPWLRYRVLFIDGIGLSAPALAGIADVVQVMSPDRHEELCAAGLSDNAIEQIPYAVDTSPFTATPSRTEARRTLGLPTEGTIVLSVAAINRYHKRIDYLVAEFAASSRPGSLVLCGAIENKELLESARRRLGPRVHHFYVPPEHMPLLYACGDVLVVTSLTEGFCLAAVEAMAAGLPVLAHDTAHFRWLLGDAGTYLDMRIAGELATALGDLRGTSREVSFRQAEKFSWEKLLPRYAQLIGELIAGSTTAATGPLWRARR